MEQPFLYALIIILNLYGIDYSAFKSETEAKGRPSSLDVYTMMVIILYARMEGKYSCREIADLCTRDLFLLSVLDGRTSPSYVTVNRFIKQNAKAIEELSSQIVICLDSYGEISRDIVFQDGTKIESRAGKYSFVWKSEVEKNLEKLKLKTDLLIDLQRDKEELNARIEKRVDIMLEEGLLAEIRKLCEMGANLSWPGMQGIGYKEFMLACENGECNLDTIRDEIISNSRKYAKRQNTFFKTFPSVNFIHPDDLEGISKLVKDSEKQKNTQMFCILLQIRKKYRLYKLYALYVIILSCNLHKTIQKVRFLIHYLQ